MLIYMFRSLKNNEIYTIILFIIQLHDTSFKFYVSSMLELFEAIWLMISLKMGEAMDAIAIVN